MHPDNLAFVSLIVEWTWTESYVIVLLIQQNHLSLLLCHSIKIQIEIAYMVMNETSNMEIVNNGRTSRKWFDAPRHKTIFI